MTRSWHTLLVIALMAASGGRAAAQERSGLMGGFSLGAGTLDFRGVSSDPAVGLVRQADGQVDIGGNLSLGAVTSPRTALLFELSLTSSRTSSVEGEIRVGSNRVTFPASEDSYTALVTAGALQFWLAPNLWVRTGFGAGVLDRDVTITDADLTITLDKGTGLAILAAAGVDVWRRGAFSLDAQIHFTSFALKGLRVNAPSVQVGFTWY
jgi:hypothetical protein